MKDCKVEVSQKYLRCLKMVLCHDFARDVLCRVYCDAMKLQVLWETDQLRRRSYLLPRDSIFMEMFPSRSGEHAFAGYNEEAAWENGLPERAQQLFYNKEDNRVSNFWRLPNNKEVIDIEVDYAAFKRANLPDCFNYELGNASEGVLPQFINADPLALVLAKRPKFTHSETKDIDGAVKAQGRVVDFTQAFDYKEGADRVCLYLSYFKSINNIYDLEFFTNKLSSSAHTLSNVEKMVLSGVPFWEEGEDALFDSDDEDAQSGAEGQAEEPAHVEAKVDDDRFDEGGHKPLRNVLAAKVVDKLADQKREKMQLMQDLETIKENFTNLEVIMKKQEMASSLKRACDFLAEQHQVRFYGILATLYERQDRHYKDKKGQKEIAFIQHVIRALSHQ